MIVDPYLGATVVAVLIVLVGARIMHDYSHHSGHLCLMTMLERHDPLLGAMVIIVLHRRGAMSTPRIDDAVAWLVHLHKIRSSSSIVEDDDIGDELRTIYKRLQTRVKARYDRGDPPSMGEML